MSQNKNKKLKKNAKVWGLRILLVSLCVLMAAGMILPYLMV